MRALIAAAAVWSSAASFASGPQQGVSPGGESVRICNAQRTLADERYLNTTPGVGGSGLAGTDSEAGMIFRGRMPYSGERENPPWWAQVLDVSIRAGPPPPCAGPPLS
ncbi:MAG: hypothetical protein IRZ16_12140 [Myxococcaceae bacterium]|nr:hypothetical protein [Myxococcaceae bacterium]